MCGGDNMIDVWSIFLFSVSFNHKPIYLSAKNPKLIMQQTKNDHIKFLQIPY